MECDAAAELISAEIDGALDPAGAKALTAHLAGCATCRPRRETLRRFVAGVRANVPRAALPLDLAARIRADIRREASTAPAGRWRKFANLAAACLVGAVLSSGLTMHLVEADARSDMLIDAAVDTHVRGLVVGPVVAVETSDRHTVKPWFDGRIGFAPPVFDLAADGFQLVGGRLDYLARAPAATLVFRHRAHSITLLVLAADGRASVPARAERAGYALVGWRSKDLAFTAVSDIPADELEKFRDAFRAAEAKPDGQ